MHPEDFGRIFSNSKKPPFYVCGIPTIVAPEIPKGRFEAITKAGKLSVFKLYPFTGHHWKLEVGDSERTLWDHLQEPEWLPTKRHYV
jgi:hypothetical protein